MHNCALSSNGASGDAFRIAWTIGPFEGHRVHYQIVASAFFPEPSVAFLFLFEGTIFAGFYAFHAVFADIHVQGFTAV